MHLKYIRHTLKGNQIIKITGKVTLQGFVLEEGIYTMISPRSLGMWTWQTTSFDWKSTLISIM
ncbi:Uncharacterised protein [Pseudomonas luteola]|uniref:Uncharacterized protein n=2 Tax=Pseudomonas TaxID=286 RepID=A0A2X2CA21_PSELU|nr:hypothetical protein SAMN05216409_11497 [Pseudomonas lutea]SPZ04977.1 Uncharacterised protein [Pseudomonas luteola]